MIEIKHRLHWDALESELQIYAYENAKKGGHKNPATVKNNFKFGAVLLDNKEDFKIRELPINSNFSDSRPTAMITTSALLNSIIDNLYIGERHSGNANRNSLNNIIWLLDLLWCLAENTDKGVMFLGGELKKGYRMGYSNDFHNSRHFLSKRYSSLYPSKKWLREKEEAYDKAYEGYSEEETKAFDEFRPVNPILMNIRKKFPYDEEEIRGMKKYKRRKNIPSEWDWESGHIDACLKTEILKLRNTLEKKNA